jgi:UDP-galactopyranose mutase
VATTGTFDYLVVGAGFAGSVLAERLARDLKQTVMLCDRRNHVGGNAHDRLDNAGVLIHQYGPHIFHTNSKEIFDYLSQFTAWHPYEHRVLASVGAKLYPVPVNLDTINAVFGMQLGEAEAEKFLATVAETRDPIQTSEDVVLSRVGRELYEKFFRGYTRKQWGLDPSQLDAQVALRIPVRTNRDDRYFTDAFQFMPKNGFTRMFENMLDHPRITLELNADYREVRDKVRFRHLIFTGPIDEYFDYRFGKLPYRSLEVRHRTLDREWLQPVSVVKYPNEFEFTRVTEFKHLTGQQHSKTSVVYEYPRAEGDAYYPIPRPETAAIYNRYRELANLERRVHFVGRLATYRYYNMDQVVGQALTLYGKIAKVTRRAAAARHGDVATSPRVLQRRRGHVHV